MPNTIAKSLEKLFFGSVGQSRTIQNAKSLSPTDEQVITVFDQIFSPPRASAAVTISAATGSIDLSTGRNFVVLESYTGDCAITLNNAEEGVLYTFSMQSVDGSYHFLVTGYTFTFGITPSVNSTDIIQMIIFGTKAYFSAFAQAV